MSRIALGLTLALALLAAGSAYSPPDAVAAWKPQPIGGLTWLDKGPSHPLPSPRCDDRSWRRLPSGQTAKGSQRLQDIWLVTNGIPAHLSTTGVLFAVQEAARTWSLLVNDCHIPGPSGFSFRSMGTLNRMPLPDYDGIQTVLFASGVCYSPLHVACLFPESDPSTGKLTGWDIVLDPRYPWGTQHGPWLDVQAVLTHELGHVVGLDDMGTNGSQCTTDHMLLTMYGCTWPGDTIKRTLAAGDALGGMEMGR